jgi:hypothetical protein
MKPSKPLTRCLLGLAGVALVGALAHSATSPPAASPQNQQILARLKQEHGFVPKAIQVIAQRTATLPKFMAYGKDVLAGGPLGSGAVGSRASHTYVIAWRSQAVISIRLPSGSRMRAS